MLRKSGLAAEPMQSMPIARRLLFETRDLDEAREGVGRVFCRHRLAYAGQGRDLSFRQNLAPLGRLALSYIVYGADVEIDAGEPGDWFMVHSQHSGHCAMRIGGRDVVACAHAPVVSSATLGLRMTWTARCSQVVLKVERPALEQHLRVLLNDDLRRPIEFAPEPASGTGAHPVYRRLLDFITAEAEEDDTFLGSAPGLRHLEEMLMTLLLTRFPNNYSRPLSLPASPAVPRHVRLAEDFIIAHAGETLSITQIAAAAGVGVRTLFDGFERFRGMAPMAWVRKVRLEGARADLRAARQETCVTEIALKWGFTNIGRFAEAYRARYGELPSQTLRLAPWSETKKR